MPNLTSNPLPHWIGPDGHLTDDALLTIAHLLATGDRHLVVHVHLQDAVPPGTRSTESLVLPGDPAMLANALDDLSELLDPKPKAPGREEPLEAPELADTLADAYTEALAEGYDGSAEGEPDLVVRAAQQRADDLLAALGAVLASAYLEGRSSHA